MLTGLKRTLGIGAAVLCVMLGAAVPSAAAPSTTGQPSEPSSNASAEATADVFEQCSKPIEQRVGNWNCGPWANPARKTNQGSKGDAPITTFGLKQVTSVGGWGSCLYDTCWIRRTAYIADSYADGLYGQGATTIGKYRIRVHDNLNGRSTRQTTSFSNLSGPTLDSLYVTTRCREDVPNWPDNTCGYQDPFWKAWVNKGSTVVSRELQGAKLNNNATYYTQVYGELSSIEHSDTFPIPQFETARFACHYKQNCMF